jgi:lysyl-tRNA synthetase class 2
MTFCYTAKNRMFFLCVCDVMKFTVDSRIWGRFPEVKLAVLYISDISNGGKNAQIKDLLKSEEKLQREKLESVDITTLPEVAPWRVMYQLFGSNPDIFRPSVEALLRRVVEGKPLPAINLLVDIYNYISIKYKLPVGAEDLDATEGDITLTFAEGDETGKYIGSTSAEVCDVGEVIYRDRVGFLCRKWNWREADRTKITPKTKHAIMVIELAPDLPVTLLEQAVVEAKVLFERYLGAHVVSHVISREHSLVDIAYTSLREMQDKSIIAESARKDQSHSEEYEIRLKKVDILRERGIEPWPANRVPSTTCALIHENFESYNPISESEQATLSQEQLNEEERNKHNPSVAGRIMTQRLHGKAAFATIQDVSGALQLYFKEELLGDMFKVFTDLIDIGDIIWCRGVPFKTQRGEVTLRVMEFALLSKCLHPLPDKVHGLADIEIKYRQRYLDLIVSPEARSRFHARSEIIRSIRSFLDTRGYAEVETPMLHPIAGGAAARPFVTHHNALDSEFFLRIAPELYLKRLVVGGMERVYEINRNFRNEGISTRHNPEFTMLELYTAYEDLDYAMNLVEQLLRTAAVVAQGKLQLSFGDHVLDFEAPFRRLSMKDAVCEYGNFDESDISPERITAACARHKVSVEPYASYGHKLAALFEHVAEHKLIQPTFIHEFPIELSPLAKRDPQNPDFAPRFELFVAGMELSNAYHELNDPFEQAERFREQLALHEAGDIEAHQFDADYVRALEYGLPPTVGIGVGIDRLTMILTATTSIKEVILFPTLKRV